MKINKITIKKFRNLSNISIKFGPKLNAIAGQNGTSKTSILGLIGHTFIFPQKYKNLLGKQFVTQFSEIFRFAYPQYDKAGEHVWETEFEDGNTQQAISYDRKERGKKKTIRIRVGKSKKGSGKIHLPVIYLGMGRLFPLALEKNIRSSKSSLTSEESEEFQNLHNEILLLDEKVIPENVECSSKQFYAPTTSLYNHLGNSSGQDNLGQIITALISFKRLRENLEKRYRGGILLIDELDASLYPAAQMKLVEKLNQKAAELDLQIFFTTHSLEVLAETKKYDGSKIIFLDKSYGKIVPKYNFNPSELSQKLLVLGPDTLKEEQHKKNIYCEDDEAVDFLNNILSKEIKSQVNIFSTKLGNTFLKELAKKRIPDLKNSIIVLDGDSRVGNISNIVTLPGNKGPDLLIYEMLKSLPEEHDLWKRKSSYYKQYCFKELQSLNSTTDQTRKRVKVKKWYKSQKKYWGRSANYVWKIWIQNNKDEVEEFFGEISLRIQ